MRQKGIIHLIPLEVIFVLVVAGAIFYVVSQGIVKLPSSLTSLFQTQKGPKVELQTQYQNPFEKSSQYVNPFAGYKNPFDQLK